MRYAVQVFESSAAAAEGTRGADEGRQADRRHRGQNGELLTHAVPEP